MPVLKTADDVRLGADGASRVYFGADVVWESYRITVATGGTVSDVTIGGRLYRLHTFTNTEGQTVYGVPNQFFTVSSAGQDDMEVLVVGAGGSGGSDNNDNDPGPGGGGGGGRVVQTTISPEIGAYTVEVSKGVGISSFVGAGTSTRSYLLTPSDVEYFAPNGGIGKPNFSGSPNGGSSGGGAGVSGQTSAGSTVSGTPVAGVGNVGGSGSGAEDTGAGGGGGGAGGAGGNGTSGNSGGNGGAGYIVSITGADVLYGAGGGGGAGDGVVPGSGGSGGGGAGGAFGGNGQSATSFAKGSGSGGAGFEGESPGRPDQGVVIIRYPLEANE